jgi:hypothetical protein
MADRESPVERAVTDILTLGSFVAGFVVAWLLRTGYVMAKLSWAQEQMEYKVRYWQGEALHARAVADRLLCQLEVSTGNPSGPADWPDMDSDWHGPDSNHHS